MNKRILVLVLAICLVAISFSILPIYADKAQWENLIKQSTQVFNNINTSPDQGIPKGLVYTAQGIAIFPNTVSGGFIAGIKKGQGVLVCRTKDGWSAPAILDMDGGSLGFQFGIQETDIILVFPDKSTVDGLLKSKIEIGAGVGASVGPVGRDAQLGADLQMKGVVYSYSKSRGAYIGLKLEGTSISPNDNVDKEIYEKDVTAEDIVINNKVKPTQAGEELIKAITEYTKDYKKQ